MAVRTKGAAFCPCITTTRVATDRHRSHPPVERLDESAGACMVGPLHNPS